jgi:hypothetical protein
MIETKLLSALVLAFAASASQSKSVKTADAEEGIVCHDETPVGKMISTRVCRRTADMDADREQGQKTLGAVVNRPTGQSQQVMPSRPSPKTP